MMHPAADVFRDHVLSHVNEENKKLREGNDLLDLSRQFLCKIEIRLRSGQVATATLKDTLDDHDDYLSISVDSDPQPLSSFSAGGVWMLGRKIGAFPGRQFLLGTRRQGNILVRFSLSKKVAVEGVLQGLSGNDFNRYKMRTQPKNQILTYLTQGEGLENPSSITFVPTMMLIDIPARLESTLNLIYPLPSLDMIKNDLECYIKTPRKSKRGSERLIVSPYEKFNLSIVAAVGYTDSQVKMLSENHLLRRDNLRLTEIRKMVNSVDVVHQGFNMRFSLEDGRVCDGQEEGAELVRRREEPMWRVSFISTVKWRSITRSTISQLQLFLSGMPLTNERLTLIAADEDGSLRSFSGTFENEVKISAHITIHQTSGSERASMHMTVDFPLSFVQNILEVLGVDVVLSST